MGSPKRVPPVALESMKFAKQLQHELNQEWNDYYVDYKLMKKTLKKPEPEAASRFCGLLVSQLAKVHAFMSGQQRAIRADIRPLELLGGPEEGPEYMDEDHIIDDRCGVLVQHIENFRNYTALNNMAIRKIIKKFDKRFQARFHEASGVPEPGQLLLLSEHDIAAWLLDPALRCLRLAHSVAAAHLTARQFDFWVEELVVGAKLTGLRVGGASLVDPTPVRLLRCLGESQASRWCVRNTFIDLAGDVPVPRVRRSLSLPPPAAVPVPEVAEPSECGDADAEPEGEGLGGAGRGGSASSGRAAAPRPSERRAEAQPNRSALPARRAAGGAGGPRQLAPQDVTSASWWRAVREACPLSGFPLSLLPYPPFKLPMGPGRPPKLVDGLYLVLMVLSTWRFEALGRALHAGDASALDRHIQRCKLGPFRIGRAMELLAEDTPDSREKFARLRALAQRRLVGLSHIKRLRLERGDALPQRRAPTEADRI